MALVHDMAECIVGDLTPHDNISKKEKHCREEVTLAGIIEVLFYFNSFESYSGGMFITIYDYVSNHLRRKSLDCNAS